MAVAPICCLLRVISLPTQHSLQSLWMSSQAFILKIRNFLAVKFSSIIYQYPIFVCYKWVPSPPNILYRAFLMSSQAFILKKRNFLAIKSTSIFYQTPNFLVNNRGPFSSFLSFFTEHYSQASSQAFLLKNKAFSYY